MHLFSNNQSTIPLSCFALSAKRLVSSETSSRCVQRYRGSLSRFRICAMNSFFICSARSCFRGDPLKCVSSLPNFQHAHKTCGIPTRMSVFQYTKGGRSVYIYSVTKCPKVRRTPLETPSEMASPSAFAFPQFFCGFYLSYCKQRWCHYQPVVSLSKNFLILAAQFDLFNT